MLSRASHQFKQRVNIHSLLQTFKTPVFPPALLRSEVVFILLFRLWGVKLIASYYFYSHAIKPQNPRIWTECILQNITLQYIISGALYNLRWWNFHGKFANCLKGHFKSCSLDKAKIKSRSDTQRGAKNGVGFWRRRMRRVTSRRRRKWRTSPALPDDVSFTSCSIRRFLM